MGGEEGHQPVLFLHCVKTMGQSGGSSSARRQASGPSPALGTEAVTAGCSQDSSSVPRARLAVRHGESSVNIPMDI